MDSEVKCEHCGTINLGGSPKCRMCGWPLLKAEPGFKACPECGETHTPETGAKCISCGWEFGPSRRPHPSTTVAGRPDEACEHWSELPAHTSRSAMLDMAGILILLAGALGITHALLSTLPVTGSDLLTHYENLLPPGKFLDSVIQDNDLVAAMMFLTGALAMGLSMSVFMRGRLSLALTGGALGIVAIGFLIGAFFALVGLLILVVSKREFLAECH